MVNAFGALPLSVEMFCSLGNSVWQTELDFSTPSWQRVCYVHGCGSNAPSGFPSRKKARVLERILSAGRKANGCSVVCSCAAPTSVAHRLVVACTQEELYPRTWRHLVERWFALKQRSCDRWWARPCCEDMGGDEVAGVRSRIR